MRFRVVGSDLFHRVFPSINACFKDTAKGFTSSIDLQVVETTKTVSPGHKRQVAERLVARGQCSMRGACRYFHLHRSTYAYRAKYPDAWLTKLKAAGRRLSRQYARWGYLKITKLLKDEGWQVGKRLVQGLRRVLGGLAIPPTQAKRPNNPTLFGSTTLSTI